MQPGRVSKHAPLPMPRILLSRGGSARRFHLIAIDPSIANPAHQLSWTGMLRRANITWRLAVIIVDERISEDSMIHHLSIAAREPKRVAGVLAELMGGSAVPFPPNPGSFFALQLDDHGSGVEVYPAGTELRPGGTDGGGLRRDRTAGGVTDRPILPSASLPMPKLSKRSPRAKAGNASAVTGGLFT